MPKTVKIAVARIWHEANSFNPRPTTLDDFRQREWTAGDEALVSAAGTETELGGLARFIESRPHWDVTVLRCTSAPPGGLVEKAAYQAMTEEILSGLRDREWDGVYISLHGAMVAEHDLAPDYSFVKAVRDVVGPTPLIAVSLDLHACIDSSVASDIDILSGYHTYPHIDMAETATRCLDMLEAALAGGQRPRVILQPVPFLPLSHGMRTQAGPMRELVELARSECIRNRLADVTVFGGFTYADTPNTRATIAVIHRGNPQGAQKTADKLAEALLKRRHSFSIALPNAHAGLEKAIRQLEAGSVWPIAVIDAADNPLSGGIGDTTEHLRTLVEMNPPWPSLFCFFHDPDLVASAHDAGIGSLISCELGGRVDPRYGAPVPFEGIVETLTNGRFRNRGPMERGREIDLGRTAVLRARQMRVVITETCQSANDPAWCDLHGIDLSGVALFCVKAKNHFRAGFENLCASIIDIDCPGPAPVNLRHLPFRHVPEALIG